MVLRSLVHSIQRLLRRIREAAMVSCDTFRDPPSSMEVSAADNPSASATGILTVDRSQERVEGIDFMAAARLQPAPPRNPSSKRKLDELDVSAIEFSARARREEPQDAESSGRLRRSDDQSGEVDNMEDGFLEEVSKVFGKEDSGDGDPGKTDSVAAMDVDRANASHLQFFVKTYIQGKTIVLHAKASDTVESVHQQILLRTGLPLVEQRLIFGGRQLQHDQTLESCQVTNDATLHLVARMRSTALPHSWQLINDLVTTIRNIYGLSDDQLLRLGSLKLTHCQDCVLNAVQEFLKMASKSVPVLEHMQVFQLSGATSALVMLLLSRIETNRLCAEESINMFASGSEDYLPIHLHCHCAPVLLDFCKLLAKSAPGHRLYSCCRSALARLLDRSDTTHGNTCFNGVKPETIVSDFSPFVSELADSLLTHLQAYRSSPDQDFTSYIKEAKDFTAFVCHLCKSIAGCKLVNSSCHGDEGCPVNGSGDQLELRFNNYGGGFSRESLESEVSTLQLGSLLWLDTVFRKLLVEMEQVLASILRHYQKTRETGSRDEERLFSRAPFLYVLKGLNAIGRLWDYAGVKLVTMLHRQQDALNLLVRQSRIEDDFWLLEYKALLDFESKKRIVMGMLPEPQDDHEERQEITVRRSQLLADSLDLLVYVEPDYIQGGLSVEFATEEATGPGVLREWFFMVCKELFNPQFALFVPCPNDRRRFYPNPASGVNPGHFTYFKFCGRVIALALMHRIQVDVTFAIIFFKQLAGYSISWNDCKDADPVLYASCKHIMEMEPEAVDSDSLGLTFVTEMEMLGSRTVLELCPGGKDIAVTSTNRHHFVDLIVQRRLSTSVAEQVKCFAQGFSDLLPNSAVHEFLRPLDLCDLDLILFGKDRAISVEDWEHNTEYHDYSPSDDQPRWFWEVVETMCPERRRNLLFFATSVTHLPPEGFAGLSSKFHIHRAASANLLPTAHTCFYQLMLPPYDSFSVMHRSLYTITADHVVQGFGYP